MNLVMVFQFINPEKHLLLAPKYQLSFRLGCLASCGYCFLLFLKKKRLFFNIILK